MAKKRAKSRAKHTFDYDLIVIGSGAGGSVAATVAAREGWEVAIIEEDTFGGDSSNWGDVPISSLLHVAHLYDDAKNGSQAGLRSSSLSYNYPTIRAWKDTAVRKTGVGNDRSFYTKQGIATFFGKAHFLTPNEITVNRRHISAKRFLIATGAEWEVPNIQGIEDIEVHTPRTILEKIRPPKSLAIIGGSKQAIEVAQIMAIFGTKVTILESARIFLPKYDKEVGEQLSKSLEKNKNITVLTSTKPLAVVKEGRTKRLTISRGDTSKHLSVEEIMVAGNFLPNTDLGLENAVVEYAKSGIKVNSHLRTSAKHIYAVGAVLGRDLDTNATLMESRIAVHNMLNKEKMRPDYSAVASVILSNPEVAHVGMSEKDTRREKIAARWATVPLSAVAASYIANDSDGFVKLIVNSKGVVIGGTIVGPNASETIHEIAVAVKHKLTARQLYQTPHVFLSWSEAIKLAAQKLAIHGGPERKR